MAKKTSEDLEKLVKEEYPVFYYKQAYEAVFDAELQNAWLSTKDARELFGNDHCDKQLAENKDQIRKAKVKMKFLKDYFEIQ